MSTVPRAKLRYEPLHASHLDVIDAIEEEAYPESWSRIMFLDEIRSARSFFCSVFIEDRLIGYGGFWLVLDEAHVTSVTIDAAERGNGYGRELMQYLLEAARERNVKRATLEVRDSNTTARNLYASLGFDEVGLRKGYYSSTGEDAVIMTKDMT